MAEPYNPFAEFQGPEWEATDPYTKFMRFNQVFYALPEFANQSVGTRELFRNKVLGFKDTGEMLKSVMGQLQQQGADERTSAETFNEIARHWKRYEALPISEKQKFRQMLPGAQMVAPHPTEQPIAAPGQEIQALRPGEEATTEGAIQAIGQDFLTQQLEGRRQKARAEYENRRKAAESLFMFGQAPGMLGGPGRAIAAGLKVPIVGDFMGRVLENVGAFPAEATETTAQVSELAGNVVKDVQSTHNLWNLLKQGHGNPAVTNQILARAGDYGAFAEDNIFNEVADSLAQIGYDWMEEVRLSVPDTPGAVRSVAEVDGWGDGLRFIAGASGDMAGFMGKIIAGQAIGGPLGGMLATALPTTSEIAHEIYRTTGGEIHPDLTLPAGLANAALEKVGFDMIGHQFTREFRGLIRRGITARLVGSIQTGTVEGLTEATQQLIQMFANRAALTPEQKAEFPKGFWEQVTNLTPDEFAQLVDSAAAGFAGGLVMGGVGNAYNSYLKDLPPEQRQAAEESVAGYDEQTKAQMERIAQAAAKTGLLETEVKENPEFQDDINKRDLGLLIDKYGMSEEDAAHVILRYAQAKEGAPEAAPAAEQGAFQPPEGGVPIEETVGPVTPEAAPEAPGSEQVTARALQPGDTVFIDNEVVTVTSVETGERGKRTITFDNGETEIVSPNTRYTKTAPAEVGEQQLAPDQTEKVRAGDLAAGDQIVGGDGQILTVESVEASEGGQRTITFDNGDVEIVNPRLQYTKWAPAAREAVEQPPGPAFEPEAPAEEFKPPRKKAFKPEPPQIERPEAPPELTIDEAISRLAGYGLDDAANAAALLRTGGDLGINERAALDKAIAQSEAGEIDENLAPALRRMLRGKLEAAPNVRQKAATAQVLGIIQDGAETVAEIAAALPEVSRSEIRKALIILREQGKIGRQGEGRPSSPFTYSVPGGERQQGEPPQGERERTPAMERKAKRYKALLDAANTMEELDAVAELWAQEKSRPWWIDFEGQVKKKRGIISKIGQPRRPRAPAPQKAPRSREEMAGARRKATLPKPEPGRPGPGYGPFGRIVLGVGEERRKIQRRNVTRMIFSPEERAQIEAAGLDEAQRRVIEKIAQQREANPATNLPNKAAFNREFTPSPNEEVVFLDVDNLKEANDKVSHAAGDQLLVTIADTILDHVPRDRVFHLSGDEFAIIAPKGEGRGLGRRIRNSLPKSFQFEGKTVNVGFAYGVGENLDIADKAAAKEKAQRQKAGLSRVRRTGEEAPAEKKKGKKRKKKGPEPKRSLSEIERIALREVRGGLETTGDIARKTSLPRDLIRKAFHSLAERGIVRLEMRLEGEREKLFARPTLKGEEQAAREEYAANKAAAKEQKAAEKQAREAESPTERLEREYNENPTPIKTEREARDRRSERGAVVISPAQELENDEEAARAQDEWASRGFIDRLARGKRGITRGLMTAFHEMKAAIGAGWKESQADFRLLDNMLDRITRNREQRVRDGKIIHAFLAGEEGATAEWMNHVLKGRLTEADIQKLRERRDENTRRHNLIVNSDILPESVRQKLMEKSFYLRRAYDLYTRKANLLGRQRRHQPRPEDKQEAIGLVAAAYGKEVRKIANRLYQTQKEVPADFDFVGFFKGYDTDMLRNMDPDLADRLIGLRNQVQHFTDAIDIVDNGTDSRIGIVERADGLIDMAKETVEALISNPNVIRGHGGMIQIGNLQERFLTDIFRRLYGEIHDPAILQALTT